MNLSYDTARCVGYDLRNPFGICTQRETCERHRQIARDREAGMPDYQMVSMMAMPRRGAVCEYRIELDE